MLTKTTSKLTAQKLRLILIASIFLLLAAAIAVFILVRGMLAGYAVEVQKVSDTAASSGKNLSTLGVLKTKLAEEQEAVERAKNLVAESKSYAYQDQIIKDLNTFASKSGITIAGFQFNNDAFAPSGTAPAPAAAPTAGAAAPTTVNGLKTVSVAIDLKSPIKYENAMEFVHMIEQNLTKMQLAGISMSKDPASNNVTVSSLTIEVYVR